MCLCTCITCLYKLYVRSLCVCMCTCMCMYIYYVCMNALCIVIMDIDVCVCVQSMCMSFSLPIKQNHALWSDDKINIISLFGVMIRSI